MLDLDLEVLEFSLRLMLGVGSLVGIHSLSSGMLASLLSLNDVNFWSSPGDNLD